MQVGLHYFFLHFLFPLLLLSDAIRFLVALSSFTPFFSRLTVAFKMFDLALFIFSFSLSPILFQLALLNSLLRLLFLIFFDIFVSSCFTLVYFSHISSSPPPLPPPVPSLSFLIFFEVFTFSIFLRPGLYPSSFSLFLPCHSLFPCSLLILLFAFQPSTSLFFFPRS